MYAMDDDSDEESEGEEYERSPCTVVRLLMKDERRENVILTALFDTGARTGMITMEAAMLDSSSRCNSDLEL